MGQSPCSNSLSLSKYKKKEMKYLDIIVSINTNLTDLVREVKKKVYCALYAATC